MRLENYLEKKGIRITQGRMLILNIIKESKFGLSAEDIYYKCKESNLNLNRSTIYRNLETLEQKDIIHKINTDISALYIFKRDSHKHRLKCSICSKIVEIPCPMQGVEEFIKAQAGFKLMEHRLELKGICDNCNK